MYQDIELGHLTGRLMRDFWSKVVRGSDDECWQWIGRKAYSDRLGKHAYGVWHVTGLTFKAHRISYLLKHGSIDSALTLDHLCRNKLCVNPAHLEAVTLSENVKRSKAPLSAHYSCGHDRIPGRSVCPPCQVKRVAASQSKNPEYYREMKRINKRNERARKSS